MRLFLAVEFDDGVKEKLSQRIQELKQCALRGRFTRTENLHLTLIFLGETERVESIREVVDRTKGEPFSFTISGTGRFRRPGGDIYWAGVSSCPPLESLYRQLADGLRRAGFTVEQRPFRPHVTLARETVLQGELPEREDISCQVFGVSLMKSERIQGKLVYSCIYFKKFHTNEK